MATPNPIHPGSRRPYRRPAAAVREPAVKGWPPSGGLGLQILRLDRNLAAVGRGIVIDVVPILFKLEVPPLTGIGIPLSDLGGQGNHAVRQGDLGVTAVDFRDRGYGCTTPNVPAPHGSHD